MKCSIPMWAVLALTMAACGGAGAQAKGEEGCCGDKEAAAAAAPAAPAATAANLPAEAVCPVSGEKFAPDASTQTAEYKGKTAYFCCPGCSKKFAADPDKFGANLQ